MFIDDKDPLFGKASAVKPPIENYGRHRWAHMDRVGGSVDLKEVPNRQDRLIAGWITISVGNCRSMTASISTVLLRYLLLATFI